MNLKSVKTASDLPFKGIELVRVDKNITEVVIGGKLRIRSSNTYSNQIEVLVESPYETARRHRLTATIDGFDPKVSYFEHKFEADNASAKLEDKGASVVIDETEVQIDDAGNVVAAETATPVANDELVPF